MLVEIGQIRLVHSLLLNHQTNTIPKQQLAYKNQIHQYILSATLPGNGN